MKCPRCADSRFDIFGLGRAILLSKEEVSRDAESVTFHEMWIQCPDCYGKGELYEQATETHGAGDLLLRRDNEES